MNNQIEQLVTETIAIASGTPIPVRMEAVDRRLAEFRKVAEDWAAGESDGERRLAGVMGDARRAIEQALNRRDISQEARELLDRAYQGIRV